MTMAPIWKKCPQCHKKYDWNPDAGNFNCPYCRGLEKPMGGIFDTIFGKKKDTKKSSNEESDFES